MRVMQGRQRRKSERFRRALFFGTFDGIHEGHLAALREARTYAHELVVGVPRDVIVKTLKGRFPRQGELVRRAALRKTGIPTRVVLGDEKIGTYAIVKKLKPDLICLGYDQKELKKDLQWKMQEGIVSKIPLKTLKAHYPRTLHSSLLRKRVAGRRK